MFFQWLFGGIMLIVCVYMVVQGGRGKFLDDNTRSSKTRPTNPTRSGDANYHNHNVPDSGGSTDSGCGGDGGGGGGGGD